MKQHLKSLDTFRAIAALIVVWSHIELVKERHHFERIDFLLFPNAHYSVTLFFVLSGFLITYLLVKEKEKYKTIYFKKFYIRRLLRIWPLYYLVLLLSYVLIDSDIPIRTVLLCGSFFSNIPPALRSSWLGSPQVWSIGVEEQFYLFWPLAIYFIPKKKIMSFLVLFVIAYTFIPTVVYWFIGNYNMGGVGEKLYSFTISFFHMTKFNCMAFGGIIGYNLALNKKWLRVFYSNKYWVWTITVFTVAMWFTDSIKGQFTEECYAVLFGLVILGHVKNPIINIDNKVTMFLGKISYGIYMYHWIILELTIRYTSVYTSIKFYNVFLYSFVFLTTILVSWISFNTFEKYFLNIKKKYESY